MPNQKKKMTSFMVAELLEKRKVGWNLKDLADYFRIDHSTVAYWIKKAQEGKSLIPAWPFENLTEQSKPVQQQSELNKTAAEISKIRNLKLPETKWERKFYDLYGKIGTEREVAFFKKEYKNSNPFGL